MDLGHIGIWSIGLRSFERVGAIQAAKELENLGFGTLWIPGRKEGVFERAGDLLAATSRIVVATGDRQHLGLCCEGRGHPASCAYKSLSRSFYARIGCRARSRANFR